MPNDKPASHNPAIILANDDADGRQLYGDFLRAAFPAADIITVEHIADVYGAIRRAASQGSTVAAIVSDERFELAGDNTSGSSGVRATSEVPDLRKALEVVFGDAGRTTPIILVSGGGFFTSPPAHTYFLDIECWRERLWNEANPLYRLLNSALGLSGEALDASSLRRTTEGRLWGDKPLGRGRSG